MAPPLCAGSDIECGEEFLPWLGAGRVGVSDDNDSVRHGGYKASAAQTLDQGPQFCVLSDRVKAVVDDDRNGGVGELDVTNPAVE